MPIFHQFDGFRLDVRSRDHNPPHFHVIGADFHATIRIDTLEIMRGRIPNKVFREVADWASGRRDSLLAEWRRLNERD